VHFYWVFEVFFSLGEKKSKRGCPYFFFAYYHPPCQTQNGANRSESDRKLFLKIIQKRVVLQTEVRTIAHLFETESASKRRMNRAVNCSEK